MSLFACDGCAAKERHIESLEKIVESLTRIARAKEGLPELEPQKRKPVEPMPKEVRDMINAWQTDTIREDLERRAYRLISKPGKTWDDVKELLEQYGGE